MSRVLAAFGGVVLVGVTLAAFASPFLGYDVVASVDPARAFEAPSPDHWLGTDHLGRDIAWRLLLASRHFVLPSLLACLVCVGLAVPMGALSGYVGGRVAGGVRFLFTVVDSLPRFVFVLLVLAIYGNDPVVLALAAGIAYAPTLGEAVHERLESLRSAEYVVANLAHGVPIWRLVGVHLLWAACRRLIARHLLGLFGFFLVLETTLSYLGFGVEQPEPSWGNMLAFDLDHDAAHWIPLLAPAVAIWVVYASTTWVRGALQDEGHGG